MALAVASAPERPEGLGCGQVVLLAVRVEFIQNIFLHPNRDCFARRVQCFVGGHFGNQFHVQRVVKQVSAIREAHCFEQVIMR